MDSPGIQPSGDSSTSSSSADSTSADFHLLQTAPQQSEVVSPMDDDSASDVSMPLETEDEDDELYNGKPSQAHQSEPQPSEASSLIFERAEESRKRRISISSESSGSQLDSQAIGARKRQRPNEITQVIKISVPMDRSLLPAEIWHHVFTFCPARVLGVLLQVNKAFNAYLDSSSLHHHVIPISRSNLQVLSPDVIWAVSRRLFPLPGMQIMPTPLAGKSELDMWRIACGLLCQFCQKSGKLTHAATDTTSSLGADIVLPVFQIGIRSCGACLRERLIREIDLIISLPSPLMAALPFVCMTSEFCILPTSSLQSGHYSPGVQFTKYYYGPQVDNIKREFEDVKLLGPASAEEWLKGLESRGKQSRDDYSRWERWEAIGGVSKMREAKISVVFVENNGLGTAQHTATINSSAQNKVYGSNLPHHVPISTATTPNIPHPVVGTFASKQPNRFDSPSQIGFSYVPPRPHLPVRHERTKEEVAELKAARRAEIERRCLLLRPPLTAAVLAHMASFQAAIHIIQPLTDSAWEVLEPRLLSQREEAEQRENDRIAQSRVVRELFDERRQQDLQAKGDPKDLVDREWDDIQAPLRAKIDNYAEEIIRDGWNNGDKVSLENSSLFAAEVLIYVRKRFYAEVAKDEAAVRATGREPEMDPPNGPFTRKLTLENMKWIFDTKVKPLTEHLRRELFLCNACDHASKYYGFEGVIQHFAAKHTNSMSAGSVVVHWKSEWPEYPPFNPDPVAASLTSYYPAVSSASTPSNGQLVPQNFGYGGFQTASLTVPVHVPNPHSYQESPGPYYGHPQFGGQYPSSHNGPYQPPPRPQAYSTTQYSTPPIGSSASAHNDGTYQYPQQNFSGSYQSQPQSAYSAATLELSAQQHIYPQPAARYTAGYDQSLPVPPNSLPQAPERNGEYTAQLLSLARNAREIWNLIGGSKEVPGSVKVCTIIHHILARFREAFQDDPPLSMMVEGLSNNKDMRPVRNINGLLCKACSLGMAGSVPSAQKKHLSFPQLVNHFQTAHEAGISHNDPGHCPDWKIDMVLLPDNSKLLSIANAPGMDSKRLKVFTDALPEIIPTPEPIVTNDYTNDLDHRAAGQDQYSHLASSEDKHEKYYSTEVNGKQSEESSVAYGPGEYDPRHPAELPVLVEHEPEAKATNLYIRDYHMEQEDRSYPQDYRTASKRIYLEEPSTRSAVIENYGHGPLRSERRVYVDEPSRYQNLSGSFGLQDRQESFEYHDPQRLPSIYRNSNGGDSNTRDDLSITAPRYIVQDNHSRRMNDAAMERNRNFEVAAQISQHARQAQTRLPIQNETGDAGSEDGEVGAEAVTAQNPSHMPPSDEASNAAERFLNEFRPGEDPSGIARSPRRAVGGLRGNWEGYRAGGRISYREAEEPRRPTQEYADESRVFARESPRGNHDHTGQEQTMFPKQFLDHPYVDRYASSVEQQPPYRNQSPELVDHRYKINNVVYRDERQSSHGTRYARYESVRLENDRTRSRSPVFIKMGPQAGQYREQSPAPHPLSHEPMYRPHTSLPYPEETSIERPPRPEYVRYYSDEQRQREPQYAESYELIRVSSPSGSYMIRRPVRREIATYDDGFHSRAPVYEDQVPLPRTERAFVEGEYDPRHPAPPLEPLRYQ